MCPWPFIYSLLSLLLYYMACVHMVLNPYGLKNLSCLLVDFYRMCLPALNLGCKKTSFAEVGGFWRGWSSNSLDKNYSYQLACTFPQLFDSAGKGCSVFKECILKYNYGETLYKVKNILYISERPVNLTLNISEKSQEFTRMLQMVNSIVCKLTKMYENCFSSHFRFSSVS